MTETVAILGASSNPERYANRAQHLLLEKGHRVIPVNPGEAGIDGIATLPALADIREPVDTLTVYLRPALQAPLEAQILALRPGRVIFNPGTENPALAAALAGAGIASEEACTLVLLKTGQF